jgi:hypothetical protein
MYTYRHVQRAFGRKILKRSLTILSTVYHHGQLLQFLCSFVLLNARGVDDLMLCCWGGGVSGALFMDSDHLKELLCLFMPLREDADVSNLLHNIGHDVLDLR